ncbi:TPA: 30S ribosomal protein S9 [Patescibacteria group bacterium]|uniref:Small ribosomal subunit protein uS9 n=1 Tax=candidate division Kazan bacterium GW2011_GWA1_44_22 TaxID=1620410 RepID=A0A0G1KYH1_UNCK3|nr:MAG: 30S ribosomal protein S9 [candidate division Kazan bacterium GW2011_GWA1_44_22]HCR41892.1 30S ribosomal protein S9 [Patescibacteria group bacterium]
MEATNIIFKGKYHYGTGRRKTSTARVRLYEGQGQVMINGKLAENYLNPAHLISVIMQPLVLVGMKDRFDISVRVNGGGPMSQADAIRHGVARALLEVDESLKKTLKSNKLLTRDPRAKERKKYGLKRARRAPQFSKR